MGSKYIHNRIGPSTLSALGSSTPTFLSSSNEVPIYAEPSASSQLLHTLPKNSMLKAHNAQVIETEDGKEVWAILIGKRWGGKWVRVYWFNDNAAFAYLSVRSNMR